MMANTNKLWRYKTNLLKWSNDIDKMFNACSHSSRKRMTTSDGVFLVQMVQTIVLSYEVNATFLCSIQTFLGQGRYICKGKKRLTTRLHQSILKLILGLTNAPTVNTEVDFLKGTEMDMGRLYVSFMNWGVVYHLNKYFFFISPTP